MAPARLPRHRRAIVHGTGRGGAHRTVLGVGVRQVPRSALVPAAAGAVLLAALFLLGLAARGGPYTAPAASRPTPPPPTTTPLPTITPPPPPPAATPSTPPPEVHPGNPLVGQVLLVLVLLVLALLVVLVVRQVLRHLPRRLPDRATGSAPAGSDPARPQLTTAVERALRAVEQPAARDAVVQAWLLLGAAAAAAGTPAMPAETAAEYAGRLARVHRLPGPALHHLAELYRVARFSEHPVGEPERDDARRVLTELRAGLEVR